MHFVVVVFFVTSLLAFLLGNLNLELKNNNQIQRKIM